MNDRIYHTDETELSDDELSAVTGGLDLNYVAQSIKHTAQDLIDAGGDTIGDYMSLIRKLRTGGGVKVKPTVDISQPKL